jgi:Cyclin
MFSIPIHMSLVSMTNSGVGGLPVDELNRLELEFLLYNDFNLNVTPKELEEELQMLLLFSPPNNDLEIGLLHV